MENARGRGWPPLAQVSSEAKHELCAHHEGGGRVSEGRAKVQSFEQILEVAETIVLNLSMQVIQELNEGFH